MRSDGESKQIEAVEIKRVDAQALFFNTFSLGERNRTGHVSLILDLNPNVLDLTLMIDSFLKGVT